jgi:hypothetical protein
MNFFDLRPPIFELDNSVAQCHNFRSEVDNSVAASSFSEDVLFRSQAPCVDPNCDGTRGKDRGDGYDDNDGEHAQLL